MRLKLLAPHVIDDRWYPTGTVLDPAPAGYTATPLMEGLDDEGVAAVKVAVLVVFGRFPWPYGLYPPQGVPLDDPPILRPLEENQPVYHYVGNPEYKS
jgi:hypothetical protein